MTSSTSVEYSMSLGSCSFFHSIVFSNNSTTVFLDAASTLSNCEVCFQSGRRCSFDSFKLWSLISVRTFYRPTGGVALACWLIICGRLMHRKIMPRGLWMSGNWCSISKIIDIERLWKCARRFRDNYISQQLDAIGPFDTSRPSASVGVL